MVTFLRFQVGRPILIDLHQVLFSCDEDAFTGGECEHVACLVVLLVDELAVSEGRRLLHSSINLYLVEVLLASVAHPLTQRESLVWLRQDAESSRP